MYKIDKLVLKDNTWTKIELDCSALMTKLDKMGYAENGIIKIDGTMADYPKEEQTNEHAEKLIGYAEDGIVHNGERYKRFCAGSGDIKKSTSTYINEKIYDEIHTWAMCGFNPFGTTLSVNKYCSYTALMMSSSHSMKEVFGKTIDIDRVCVVKDYKFNIKRKADMVESNLVCKRDAEVEEELNVFDGQALIQPEFVNGELCTGRAPWTKALLVPFDFHRFYRDRGITEIVDYWGKHHKVEDIDLILTESTFKVCKYVDSYETYKKAFKELNHEFYVCQREHGKKVSSMPYQQTQSLVGATMKDVEYFANRSAEYLNKYRDPKEASKLLDKNLVVATSMYPDILSNPWVQRRLQKSYTKIRNKTLGGAMPKLSQYVFVVADPVAMLQAIANKPVLGMLRKGECHCDMFDKGELDATRSPSLDVAHVIMNNVKTEYDAYLNRKAIYISINDDIYFRLRMDCDGDHLNVTQNKEYIDLVKRSLKEINYVTPTWNVPSGKKVTLSDKILTKFIGQLITESIVGICSNGVTKYFGQVDIKEN